MSSSTKRNWGLYVTEMIGFAEKVLVYTDGLNRNTFAANSLVYDACLRNLELIGEAATHLPDAVKATYAEVPWRQLIATRNRLIHGYLGLDDDIIWNLIEHHVPALLTQLKLIKLDHRPESG
jgi:uncharacterized protein with HEPN domain